MSKSTRWFGLAAFGGLALSSINPASAGYNIEFYNHFFLVNPIKVCDFLGNNCAVPNYYYADTKKIYKQADTLPLFLPQQQMNNSILLNGQNDIAPFTGWPTNNPQSASPSTINAYFTNSLSAPPGKVLYGVGWIGGNGVVYNTSAVAGYSASGRVDTVAHELGHNFGLDHNTLGAGGANNLMTAGSARSIPNGPANITPSGQGRDVLTSQQIAQVKASPLNYNLPFINITYTGPSLTISFAADATLGNLTLDHLKLDLSGLGEQFSSDAGAVTNGRGGVSSGNVSHTLSRDGSSLMFDFAGGDFAPGDSITLFSPILAGLAAPITEGMLIDMDYNVGFGVESVLDANGNADSWNIVDTVDWSAFGGTGSPTPFFGTNSIVTNTLSDPDPQPAPEPATIGMLLAGMAGLRFVRRKAA